MYNNLGHITQYYFYLLNSSVRCAALDGNTVCKPNDSYCFSFNLNPLKMSPMRDSDKASHTWRCLPGIERPFCCVVEAKFNRQLLLFICTPLSKTPILINHVPKHKKIILIFSWAFKIDAMG